MKKIYNTPKCTIFRVSTLLPLAASGNGVIVDIDTDNTYDGSFHSRGTNNLWDCDEE